MSNTDDTTNTSGEGNKPTHNNYENHDLHGKKAIFSFAVFDSVKRHDDPEMLYSPVRVRMECDGQIWMDAQDLLHLVRNMASKRWNMKQAASAFDGFHERLLSSQGFITDNGSGRPMGAEEIMRRIMERAGEDGSADIPTGQYM